MSKTGKRQKEKSGIVFLVGAGPGDPELLTLKADRLLRQADVVIHDALVSRRILDRVGERTVLIDVGKRGGRGGPKQDKINSLLIRQARKGHLVVRLKGGDPFVFARGGEEARALASAGISFQVVPGITSALAVPAYAGIPLTHRGTASGVSFVTARTQRDNKKEGLNMKALVQSRGTLVFLMGASSLGELVKNLEKSGMPSRTPAAAIRWGTTSLQKTIRGTLKSIAQMAKDQGMASPAVLVVGKVVALSKGMEWYEHLPLFGRTGVVTRAQRRAGKLWALLEDQGAEVIGFPVLETKLLPLDTKKKTLLNRAGKFTDILFTSPEAVRVFFDRLAEQGKDSRHLSGARVSVIGPGTAAELRDRGLQPDITVKDLVRSEGLLKALGKVARRTFLIPRASRARTILTEGLDGAGAKVSVLPLYKTSRPSGNRGAESRRLRASLARGEIDFVTFTSGSSVRNLVEILGNKSNSLLSKCKLISMGPITSSVLRDYGLRPDGEASRSSIEEMVGAVVKVFRKLPGRL